MVGPLSAVLGVFAEGAATLADVARATGLSRDVVDASVAHLVRLGRLDARELSLGCPSGGCGTCASGMDAAPGCGASEPSRQRSGPVLVALTLAQERAPASVAKPAAAPAQHNPARFPGLGGSLTVGPWSGSKG